MLSRTAKKNGGIVSGGRESVIKEKKKDSCTLLVNQGGEGDLAQ